MIKQDLQNIRELIDRHNRVTWKHKMSFNRIVDHCIFLEESFNEKAQYVEKLIAFFFCKELERNLLTGDDDFYPDEMWVKKFVIWKLNTILRSSIDDILLDFENNIQTINIKNKYPLEKQGKITEIFKRIIRDYTSIETKK